MTNKKTDKENKNEVFDTLDETTVARMQLTENLQREDLNHIDIARQLGKAADAGMTARQIAEEINTSEDYVRKHLDLLRLTPPVAELPVRPTEEEIEHGEIVGTIWKGKKADALAAIADCTDTATLEYLLLPKALNNIAKIATWRVKAVMARIAELEAGAKDEDWRVRAAAMQHPNATTAMLEAGAKDKDWYVREAAKRRLAARKT